MTKRMLIAGGSGLIGTALKQAATLQGYEVTILSRSPKENAIVWDPAARTIDIQQPLFFDAIINLAGASLAEGRWTKKRKAEIISSRVDSAMTIKAFLENGKLTTPCYVGASGSGIYGDTGSVVVTENSPVKERDWTSSVVLQWEDAHQQIHALGIRTLIMRFGLVLSMQGGALKEIMMPAKFGVLAYFGDGTQYWPWVHMQDVCGAMLHTIQHASAQGIYLVVAPDAVSNREVVDAANAQLPVKRIVMPAPKWGLGLMLGEMHEMLFISCRGRSVRLPEAGYDFAFPTIASAMQDLLRGDH